MTLLIFNFILLTYIFLFPLPFSLNPTFAQTQAGVPIGANNYNYLTHGATQIGISIPHGMICALTLLSPAGDCPGITSDKKLYSYNNQVGGVAAGLSNLIALTYTTPPLSSKTYLADLGKNLGIVQPAYAQAPAGVVGSGQGIINPVLALWKVTRNMAYLGFVFVFLAIGFMIMFRQRINPQTVVTAQSALPGLVIGLILVTFSYFIASLLIDIAFVGMQLVAQLFIQVINNGGKNAFGDAASINNLAQNSNAFHLFGSGVIKIPSEIGNIFANTQAVYGAIFGGGNMGIAMLVTGVIGLIVGFLAGGPVGAAIGGSIGGLGPLSIPGIISIILPLILVIALLIQFFRLLFGLISTYVQLLVSTVIGPFIILFSSLPGRGGVLSTWWRSLLANSLVFPAVFAAFLFAGVILATGNWNASPPLFGGLPTELLRLILAYGIMLGTPAIPDLVRQAFGVKPPQGFVSAALGGFAAGFGAGRAGAMRYIDPLMQERRAYAEQYRRRRADQAIEDYPAGSPRRPWYLFGLGGGRTSRIPLFAPEPVRPPTRPQPVGPSNASEGGQGASVAPDTVGGTNP